MLVAKHKKGLAVLVGVMALALSVVGVLAPPEYARFMAVFWLGWFGLAGWLLWSVLAKFILATEPASNIKFEQAFDRFEESLNGLGKEQAEMRLNLNTAITKQNTLIELLVGFLKEAENLKVRREALKSIGKTAYHDGNLGLLLMNLPAEHRQQVIRAEAEVLEAQANAYLTQAQALLNRVVVARGSIARQQMKLRATDAAIPLLEMNNALATCETRLAALNQALPEPSGLKRYLIAQN